MVELTSVTSFVKRQWIPWIPHRSHNKGRKNEIIKIAMECKHQGKETSRNSRIKIR